MMKQKLFPDAFENGNLTVRAALANNAPEIPDWFVIEFEPKPELPSGPNSGEIYNKHFDDLKIWEYQFAMTRFFQWRTFYADQLILEINKD